MNNLTPIQYQPGWFEPYVSPFQAVWDINPEIGALVYAHRYGVLDEKILPHLVNFKELQTQEKIETGKRLIENTRIQSMEYMNRDNNATSRSICQTQEEGMTKRTTLNNDASVKIAELEVLCREKYLKTLADTEKIKSENNLKAIAIEAIAYKNMIIESEQIRANIIKNVTDKEYQIQLKKIESNFLIRMQQAETLRDLTNKNIKAELMNNYLKKHTELVKSILNYNVAVATIKGREYEINGMVLKELGKSVTEVLKDKNTHSVELTSNFLGVEMNIKVKKNGN